LNASWALFDGFATRGKMEATRARRDGAMLALKAVKLGVESDVRSAFLDLQQADSVLQAQTKNVRTAEESLEFAQRNFGTGLGTQLDVLQAATDVTRTRTTRLSAIYLHNAALARLDRASGVVYENDTQPERTPQPNEKRSATQVFDAVRPPSHLGGAR
jgi:outer membrane protein TolC